MSFKKRVKIFISDHTNTRISYKWIDQEKQTKKEPVATLLIFACMYVSQFSFNGPAGPNR